MKRSAPASEARGAERQRRPGLRLLRGEL